MTSTNTNNHAIKSKILDEDILKLKSLASENMNKISSFESSGTDQSFDEVSKQLLENAIQMTKIFATNGIDDAPPQQVRTNICHSCKTTETPEWRRGPLGPRTLCNACGLVYAKLRKKEEKGGGDTLSGSKTNISTTSSNK